MVTIICLCYNHEKFVAEAIDSILQQDYPNIELIVMDDCSPDKSAEIIKEICEANGIKYIINKENIGNCAAFNRAYTQSNGDFIIDFSADDILLPNRVSVGVRELEQNGNEYGVHYSDGMMIEENGNYQGLHSSLIKTIEPDEIMPEGNIFSEVLARYFICPPTLMARRSVFEAIGGYDESLSFEDFDFIVRSARKFNYCYSPEVLVKRRIVKHSKSQGQYKKGSADLWSVMMVCEKAIHLVENKEEREALNQRLQYECRQVIIHNEIEIVDRYLDLMKRNGLSSITRTLYQITKNIYPKLFG
jgi:glycosyltransferase involved in cell wall biosynthesis